MERWENTVNIFLLNKYFSSEVSNKAKYHGVGGPLTVTKDSTKTPVIELLMEAAAELGYKVGDINGEGEDGCFTPGQVRACSVHCQYCLRSGFQSTLRNGSRTGTYKAFAEQYAGDKITVLTFAHANKVIFKGKVAVGVEVRTAGDQERCTV